MRARTSRPCGLLLRYVLQTTRGYVAGARCGTSGGSYLRRLGLPHHRHRCIAWLRANVQFPDLYCAASAPSPAAYLTFAVCVLAAPVFHPARRCAISCASFIGAVTFNTGNIALWLQTGYFGAGAAQLQAVAAVVLAIEEQYYLLLPAALASTPQLVERHTLALLSRGREPGTVPGVGGAQTGCDTCPRAPGSLGGLAGRWYSSRGCLACAKSVLALALAALLLVPSLLTGAPHLAR